MRTTAARSGCRAARVPPGSFRVRTRGRRGAATLLVLTVLLAGCGDAPAVRFGEEEGTAATPDLEAIETRDGHIRLALTEEEIYLALSENVLEDVERDMAEEDTPREGVGGRIASAVLSGVTQALRSRIAWDLEEVERLEYVDGELRVWLENGRRAWEGVEADGEPMGEQFSRADAERFIAAFEKAKGEG